MFKKHEIYNLDLMKELNTELDEIKRGISSLRKRGIETKTVEYKVMNIPSKIKMAAITNRKRDVYAIKRIFNNITADINLLERKYMEEQKKLAYMGELLDKANAFLNKRMLRECLPLYYEIRNFYKELSPESKYKVADKCVKFYLDFQSMAK